MKMIPKKRMTPKMKTAPKVKTTPKMKMTSTIHNNGYMGGGVCWWEVTLPNQIPACRFLLHVPVPRALSHYIKLLKTFHHTTTLHQVDEYNMII